MQIMTCNNFTNFISKLKFNFRFKTVLICKQKTFKGKNNTSVSFNAIITPLSNASAKSFFVLYCPQNPCLCLLSAKNVCKIV